MSTESLLGGDVGLVLVLGNEGSVLVEIFGVAGPISEENLASRVRNLLDTKSLMLEISPWSVPYRFATRHKLLLGIG